MNIHQLQEYHPPKERYQLVHEDDYILVISKPSGLLSVPGKGERFKDCLESRVQKDFPQARIVHRLDMETSGLMVMALNKDVHRILQLQFEKRKIHKTYIARVHGVMENDEGEVDYPLIVDWPRRPEQKVCYTDGKACLTKWRVLDRDSYVTRVELTPVTGRTHQLRVHMREIGHSILGDTMYATPEIEAMADRLQLHAHSLTLHHPDGGERMTLESPCPF